MNENCGTLIPNAAVPFNHQSLEPCGNGLSNIALADRFIKFIPINFETKGIDLDALTLASIIDTSSSLTKNCILNGPFIFRAFPIVVEYSIIVSIVFLFNLQGGIHIIASPEWIPALSICSIIEPIIEYSTTIGKAL